MAARALRLPRGFSSAADEARARRPTDVLLLILAALGLLAFTLAAPGPTELDEPIQQVLQALPGVSGWIWRACFALLAVWSVVLVVMAAVTRGRRILLRDYALALVLSLALATLASGMAGTSASEGLRALVTPGPPPVYLGLRVAVFTAVVVTASPHLSRPLRYVGRALMALGALASIALGVALPIGVGAGFAVGVAAGALTHLILGSPGGRPTRPEVAAGLADLGLTATSVTDAPLRFAGSALFRAECERLGAVDVKAYGRDAWDGQLLTSTWASLTRRGETPNLGAGRLACAEHEALACLLAERAGVPVLPVLEVGTTADGDVLVVSRAAGDPVLAAGAVDADLDAAWAALAALHAAGTAHGAIGPGTLVRGEGGRAVLADFAQAEMAPTALELGVDRARLLVSAALAVGPERALASALRSSGAQGLAAIVPFLQPPALDSELRRALRGADWSIKDLRRSAVELTDAEPPAMQALARVSWMAVLKVLFIAAFAYWLIGFVSQVDWSEVAQAFQSADLAWVAGALLLSPLVQVWFSFGTLGATMAPLRLVPVLMLQYSIQFIALVLPASAARVALEVRFFTKWGLAVAAAMSVGVIDSFMGFLVQIALIVVILLSGLATISPQGTADTDSTGGGDSGPSALAVVAVLVAIGFVLVLVVPAWRARLRAAIPRYRAALVEQATKARGALAVLRHPAKLALMLGGNLAAQVTQAVILWMCLQAFGQTADLAQLVLINTFVSLFAGLMPVPGGMGVAEAGYTAGLQAIGIPSAIAVSTAVMFRLVTFYLPPIWGSFAMRWLRRHEYV
ncbi:MAG TPA: lysylphosphatidylglycerol synthase transmembrane domain-containing protein [Candidatus Nanopelagicales bacterium]